MANISRLSLLMLCAVVGCGEVRPQEPPDADGAADSDAGSRVFFDGGPREKRDAGTDVAADAGGDVAPDAGPAQEPEPDAGSEPADAGSIDLIDDASVSAFVVPSLVNPGAALALSVTMTNTGTTTWTVADGIRLGSQAPQDNVTWGTSRIELPHDVPPGEAVTFVATLTAPPAAGVAEMAWQMVREGVAWFGAATSVATVVVQAGEPASAYPVGAGAIVYSAAARAAAIAYDPGNDVFLVVSGNAPIRARFVSADGVPLGAAELIVQQSSRYTHWPRVAYAPQVDGGAGGFVVTWHETNEATNSTELRARAVSFGSGAFGEESLIATSTYWEAGANIARAPNRFITTWMTPAGDVLARMLDDSGAPVGDPRVIGSSATHYHRDPAVTYNAATNALVLSWARYHGSESPPGSVAVQRLDADSGAPIGGAVEVARVSAAYMTDVACVPDGAESGRCLVVWNGSGVMGRMIDQSATPLGETAQHSVRFGSYDALSIAFNNHSRSFLVVSHDTLSAEDGGLEISAAGTGFGSGDVFTALGGLGNFYPRVAASTARAEWMIVTTHAFSAIAVQRVSAP